jgi:hypothetical protein
MIIFSVSMLGDERFKLRVNKQTARPYAVLDIGDTAKVYLPGYGTENIEMLEDLAGQIAEAIAQLRPKMEADEPLSPDPRD